MAPAIMATLSLLRQRHRSALAAVAARLSAGPRAWAALALALIALSAYAVPLVLVDLSPARDWLYFDSLSRVVRSSVLAYRRFPLHDPWVCGGLDLLANPQTRIFSPLGLLDLLLTPHLANLTSLHGFAGAAGMYALIRSRGHDRELAVLGALMFVNATWFGLHFTEGHIPFGCILWLPWVAWALGRCDQRRMLLTLCSLLAFFLLDGGTYAFVFSLYLAASMAMVGLLPVRAALATVAGNKLYCAAMALVAAGLVAPKVVPVVWTLGTAPLRSEQVTLPIRDLLEALFSVDQQRSRVLPVSFGPF